MDRSFELGEVVYYEGLSGEMFAILARYTGNDRFHTIWYDLKYKTFIGEETSIDLMKEGLVTVDPVNWSLYVMRGTWDGTLIE